MFFDHLDEERQRPFRLRQARQQRRPPESRLGAHLRLHTGKRYRSVEALNGAQGVFRPFAEFGEEAGAVDQGAHGDRRIFRRTNFVDVLHPRNDQFLPPADPRRLLHLERRAQPQQTDFGQGSCGECLIKSVRLCINAGDPFKFARLLPETGQGQRRLHPVYRRFALRFLHAGTGEARPHRIEGAACEQILRQFPLLPYPGASRNFAGRRQRQHLSDASAGSDKKETVSRWPRLQRRTGAGRQRIGNRETIGSGAIQIKTIDLAAVEFVLLAGSASCIESGEKERLVVFPGRVEVALRPGGQLSEVAGSELQHPEMILSPRRLRAEGEKAAVRTRCGKGGIAIDRQGGFAAICQAVPFYLPLPVAWAQAVIEETFAVGGKDRSVVLALLIGQALRRRLAVQVEEPDVAFDIFPAIDEEKPTAIRRQRRCRQPGRTPEEKPGEDVALRCRRVKP